MTTSHEILQYMFLSRMPGGKIWIKPLRETNLGVIRDFWPLKATMLKHRQMKNIVTFNNGKDTIIQYLYFFPGIPKRDLYG